MFDYRYKEMLDNQRRVKQEYKAYGNMTDVEKSLNRNDLLAWKNYDYTTYAMIPGFNSSNLHLSSKVEADKLRRPKVRDSEQEDRRLNIYNELNRVRNDLAPGGTGNNSPPTFETPEKPMTSNNKIHLPSTTNSLSYSKSKPKINRNQHNFDLLRNYSVDQIDKRQAPSTVYRANHPKYVKHHLYAAYDPINGAFYDNSPLNKSLDNFKIKQNYAF